MAMFAGDVIIEILGSEPPSAGLASGSEPPGVGVCLDRTFQDASGRLVDVIDEDPAWGWIPPGGQFCKKIDGIIVLSGDVM